MKFELCAASIEAIKIAGEFEFDRIELCQNLEQGGITPSYGLIEYAQAFGIETHVLIRPRAGGFVYDRDETEVILREVINCKRSGVKGVVVGVLRETGEIDKEVLKEILQKAEGMEVTFHRAFDDSIDWKKSLSILKDLGVNRILTSGMASNVEIGSPILKELKKHAEGVIEIMAGGGVNANNVGKLVQDVQPDAIHFSGTVKKMLDEESLFSESILNVDRGRVERILRAAGRFE
jgi:copper homeostasis protein